jgi:hypothetical protein
VVCGLGEKRGLGEKGGTGGRGDSGNHIQTGSDSNVGISGYGVYDIDGNIYAFVCIAKN